MIKNKSLTLSAAISNNAWILVPAESIKDKGSMFDNCRKAILPKCSALKFEKKQSQGNFVCFYVMDGVHRPCQ